MRSTILAMFAVATAAAGLASCTAASRDVTEQLESQGYTEIELGGPALIGCAKGDEFTRTWKATGADGLRYKGIACGGWLKGVTVRGVRRIG